MTTTLDNASRLLAHPAQTGADHARRLGPLPQPDPGALIKEIAASGLVGRGGAGFPTGRKLAAVASGGRAVVVANGAEGEPASAKDRHLLTTSPHLVLDGLALAARATGATRAALYAPYDLLAGVVGAALRERRDRVPVRLVEAPAAFLSGEESAVVAAVEGRRAVPFATPPRVFERGVGGRPTLVQNVETLAHLALVARFGAGWFRSLGTPSDPGTRLVTLSGAVARPGVYEVPGGARLDAVLAAAGGVVGRVPALLVGGYHGAWVPYDAVPHLTWDRDSLSAYDATPGAGVLVALGESRCGLQAGADIAGYLAGQGAQQCGPCLNGLPRLAQTLHELAYGSPTALLVTEVERMAGLVERRGACHHPDGTARLTRSTLRMFAPEVTAHLRVRCTAS